MKMNIGWKILFCAQAISLYHIQSQNSGGISNSVFHKNEDQFFLAITGLRGKRCKIPTLSAWKRLFCKQKQYQVCQQDVIPSCYWRGKLSNVCPFAAAISLVQEAFSMAVCENTHKNKEGETARRHTMLLAGLFGDSSQILCLTNFATDPNSPQVHLRVCVRAPTQEICDAVIACVN
jgi:hypothetical protein